MNISGTLTFFKLFYAPSLCLPHHTVKTFADLPVPLSKAFPGKDVDIRAVILDKDNCFAVPHENDVYEAYKVYNSSPIRYQFQKKNGMLMSGK